MTAPSALAALQPPSGRAVVMGILNVTPDSFSDGGRFAATDTAIAHGLRLQAGGADLVDVGGESTRPGGPRVPIEVELDRVIPVIRELSATGVLCSVDTTRSAVAVAALEAGAVVINDVSGGLADPDMGLVAADAGVPWILMHWRAHSQQMADHAHYDDVVADVRAELGARIEAALHAGVAEDALIIDPGIGFAKRSEHNWRLLRDLDQLVALGLPVLVGVSRKRFLPSSGYVPGSAADVRFRDQASAAITALAVAAGVWGVRVHDVAASVCAAEAARLVVTAEPA